MEENTVTAMRMATRPAPISQHANRMQTTNKQTNREASKENKAKKTKCK
jgi:hypothetical protein